MPPRAPSPAPAPRAGLAAVLLVGVALLALAVGLLQGRWRAPGEEGLAALEPAAATSAPPAPGASAPAGPRAPAGGGASAPMSAASPAATPVAAAAGEGLLQLEVREEGTGLPVAGARVDLRCSARQGVGPLAWLQPLAASTSSDAAGEARLAVPAGEGDLQVVVAAAGWRVREVLLSALPTSPLRVTLERGLALEGVLLDLQGQPLAGVRLEARHVRRARAWAAVAVEGVEQVEVRTQPDGSFRCEGLSPGSYRLAALDAGWRLLPDGPRPAAPGTFGAPAEVQAPAGTRGLRLYAQAQAHARAWLLDRGQPLPTRTWSALLRVTASGAAHALHGEAQPGAAAPEAGLVAFCVPLERAEQAAQGATLEVQVPGFEPLRAELALTAEPGPPLALELAPLPGSAWLLCEVGGTLPEGEPLVVSACHEQGGAVTRAPGRLLPGGGGAYEAGPFPAGACEVRVACAGGVSAPRRALLEAGRTTRIALEAAPPSGVRLQCLAPGSGAPVADLDTLVFAPDGLERGMPDQAARTRTRGEAPVFVPLAPGSYRWVASKGGLGYASGRVRVQAGQVVPLVARLDPDGREAARRKER
ncbi:MAG: hypothetical protein ACKOSS_06900 [Planctomycetia bacterium]